MSKASDIRVVLIACGSTEWDADNRICGSADVPLCPQGAAAAQAAAEATASEPVALVLHAPDEASAATAAAIAKAHDAKTRAVEGIAEMNLGLWEGLRREEFADRYPTASRGWRDDPASVSVPEGETLAAADERIIADLAKALERTRVGEAAVAVVLRPIAYGLATAWLRHQPLGHWRQAAEDAGPTAAYTVHRTDLKGVRDRSRTGA